MFQLVATSWLLLHEEVYYKNASELAIGER
jgi:hypothetical protein